jgi:hypothetical protein
MSDDIGVLTVAKVEADPTAAWVSIVVEVWDIGDSGRI